jgi:hypothetical protein
MVAYAKAVVMKYVNNLLNWGDFLFSQDTRESIEQATNIYVMAADLLGKRPQPTGACSVATTWSFHEIKQAYDNHKVCEGYARAGGSEPPSITLSTEASKKQDAYTGMGVSITDGSGKGETNYIVAYDGETKVATVVDEWKVKPDTTSKYTIFLNAIPEFLIRLEDSKFVKNAIAIFKEHGQSVGVYSDVPFNDIHSYFCVPENGELAAYWDRVDDRLYKIRHCMNISGQVRALALFEPPINPSELIQVARAQEVPVCSALRSLTCPYQITVSWQYSIGPRR